ncbi:Ubiquitin-fold modifier-conjugating enzyme 1 [Thelohanellus kitauei]|uniref:Ubiquitin-fold modifier-conjugating enzyme 1 n=1 Tax=Thelohanellus kitauei TaxID=669202 RepID=A0A0C2J7L1_THEKT|nr:Ubiquitin-fold modifier-conjugating enzyme 1 [Thelohanellus kitauei]
MSSEGAVDHLPSMKYLAGPRDKVDWENRLTEEFLALINICESNKNEGKDWFTIEPTADGLKWSGKCWFYHEMKKYEFDYEFELPVSYPLTPPEILIPSLDGKTAKMYRGGAICMTDHFYPLWKKHVPKFGIIHALVLGLAPWLAAEVPDLVGKNLI